MIETELKEKISNRFAAKAKKIDYDIKLEDGTTIKSYYYSNGLSSSISPKLRQLFYCPPNDWSAFATRILFYLQDKMSFSSNIVITTRSEIMFNCKIKSTKSYYEGINTLVNYEILDVRKNKYVTNPNFIITGNLTTFINNYNKLYNNETEDNENSICY